MREYWLLSSGKDGELWPTFWNEKVVALGWSVFVDLRQYADRNALDQAYHKQWPEAKPGQRRNNVTQLWSFRERVRKDDLIFVRSYGAIIGIGEVQGDYDFVPATSPLRKRLYSPYLDADYPHISTCALVVPLGWPQAIARLYPFDFNAIQFA